MLDVYGRERHPEYTTEEAWDNESYAERVARIELMVKTLSYIQNGDITDTINRILLVDEDFLLPSERTTFSSSRGTIVTSLFGQRPQYGYVIDLNGRIVHQLTWERPEQHDEVLSNIFGVEPGFSHIDL